MKESNKEWWRYQWKALRLWLVCMAAAAAAVGIGYLIKYACS